MLKNQASSMLRDFSLIQASLQTPATPSASWSLPGGGKAHWLGAGALVLQPASTAATDVLFSCGVHGNETAPVEVMESIVADILTGRLPLQVRLLVLLGNLEALAAGERYLDYDMNRLFNGAHARQPDTREAKRAAQLEGLAAAFFEQAGQNRYHYDLHTAIRGSVFEKFAIYPYQDGGPNNLQQFAWLEAAGVEAMLLHTQPASTFSYFTTHHCRAQAFTLELGKARPFGENDLSRFSGIDQALRQLITGEKHSPQDRPRNLACFKAKYDIVKLSDAFHLHLADDVQNFTTLPDGFVIAEDGETRYPAQGGEERILFPNPKVKNGLRAGIVVESVTL
jgi:succinylglutamate desuccinylase